MNNQKPINGLLRLPDVEAAIGLRRSKIYQMLGLGEFPQPVALGSKCIAWRSDDVQRWIDSRQAVSSSKVSIGQRRRKESGVCHD